MPRSCRRRLVAARLPVVHARRAPLAETDDDHGTSALVFHYEVGHGGRRATQLPSFAHRGVIATTRAWELFIFKGKQEAGRSTGDTNAGSIEALLAKSI